MAVTSPHPVAHGYAILHANGTAEWFVSSDRLSEGVLEVCGLGVTVCSPADLAKRLEALKGRTVRVDPVTTAVWFDTTLAAAGATVVDGTDPCTLPKAIKNTTEQDGARKAHALDGVATARFLHSLTVSGLASTRRISSPGWMVCVPGPAITGNRASTPFPPSARTVPFPLPGTGWSRSGS